jgi:3-oxoacyl-[acyl-carrier protein] reductase
MEKKFDGKNVFITGASRGVGKAIALALARLGMNVGLVARSQAALDAVAHEVESYGGTALAIRADLRSIDEIRDAVRRFTDRFGAVDFLICNAGIARRGYWQDVTLAEEMDIAAVNFTAPVTLMRLVVPHMLAATSGHVIVINTVGGLYAAPYQAAYCASKAALHAYCLSLAYELEKTGVHLSTIYPGPIDTGFLDGPNFEGFKNASDKVRPEDIARLVVSVMRCPRESVFAGPPWKLAAVKIANLWPAFFRSAIESKNTPPKKL